MTTKQGGLGWSVVSKDFKNKYRGWVLFSDLLVWYLMLISTYRLLRNPPKCEVNLHSVLWVVCVMLVSMLFTYWVMSKKAARNKK